MCDCPDYNSASNTLIGGGGAEGGVGIGGPGSSLVDTIATWETVNGDLLQDSTIIARTRKITDTGINNLYIGTNRTTKLGGANIWIGKDTGEPDVNTASSENNVLIGNNIAAGLNGGQRNCAFGNTCMNGVTTTSDNCVFGYEALLVANKGGNCAFGANALYLTDSSFNCAFGFHALISHTGVSGNNVAVGANAGSTLIQGSANTFLGGLTGVSSGSTHTRCIALGFGATCDKVIDQCMIGGTQLKEVVPKSIATCDMGTTTNPWNDFAYKGIQRQNKIPTGILTNTPLVNTFFQTGELIWLDTGLTPTLVNGEVKDGDTYVFHVGVNVTFGGASNAGASVNIKIRMFDKDMIYNWTYREPLTNRPGEGRISCQLFPSTGEIKITGYTAVNSTQLVIGEGGSWYQSISTTVGGVDFNSTLYSIRMVLNTTTNGSTPTGLAKTGYIERIPLGV